MNAKSFFNMRAVNQEWHYHSDDDSLWLVLVKLRFPGLNSLKEAGFFTNSSAKKWYIRRCRVEKKSESSHLKYQHPQYINNIKEELSKYRLLVEMKASSVSNVYFSGLYDFGSSDYAVDSSNLLIVLHSFLLLKTAISGSSRILDFPPILGQY